MANAPGGSFIPKRSSGKVTPARAGRRIYVFTYIAYVFFFGTLLSVVGIYFLNNQAEEQLAEHIILLDQERQKFRSSQLEDVRRFDTQLRLAQQILNSHAAPSRIFDELEPIVVESVQLNTFGYTKDEDGTAVLSLGGITESFDILLFQRDVIQTSSLLSAADFVDVSYGAATANVIEGANRDGRQTPVGGSTATKVTFTFADNSVVERIGYEPRQNTTIENVVPVDSGESEESTTGVEGSNEPQ